MWYTQVNRTCRTVGIQLAYSGEPHTACCPELKRKILATYVTRSDIAEQIERCKVQQPYHPASLPSC